MKIFFKAIIYSLIFIPSLGFSQGVQPGIKFSPYAQDHTYNKLDIFPHWNELAYHGFHRAPGAKEISDPRNKWVDVQLIGFKTQGIDTDWLNQWRQRNKMVQVELLPEGFFVQLNDVKGMEGSLTKLKQLFVSLRYDSPFASGPSKVVPVSLNVMMDPLKQKENPNPINPFANIRVTGANLMDVMMNSPEKRLMEVPFRGSTLVVFIKIKQ